MLGLLGLGALAALGLAAGLLLRWDRKWQRAALCGVLLVLLAAGVLLRSHISAALAGLGDLWGQWRFQQTGRYTPPYVGAGSVWWMLLPVGAVTGLAAGLVLRQRWRIWPAAVCAAGLLTLRLAGLVPGGWWFACFLLGVLLCFVQGSAIGRRAKTITAGALALVLLMGLLPEAHPPRRWGGGWARPCTAGTMRMPPIPCRRETSPAPGPFPPDRSRRCG